MAENYSEYLAVHVLNEEQVVVLNHTILVVKPTS
jgi:hypothetical protein